MDYKGRLWAANELFGSNPKWTEIKMDPNDWIQNRSYLDWVHVDPLIFPTNFGANI